MTIARFSIIKMGLLMLLNLAAIGSVAVSYYYHQPDGPFWPTMRPHPASYSHQFRGIFLSLLCIVFVFVQLRLLTFARGVAVFTNDGVLLYTNFNRSFFSAGSNWKRLIVSPLRHRACFAHQRSSSISEMGAGTIFRPYF
jgi:hypothetical protein